MLQFKIIVNIHVQYQIKPLHFSRNIIYLLLETILKAMLDNLHNLRYQVQFLYKFLMRFLELQFSQKNKAMSYILLQKSLKYFANIYLIDTYKKQFQYPKNGNRNNHGSMYQAQVSSKLLNIEFLENLEKNSNFLQE